MAWQDTKITIEAYREADLDQIVALSLRAWEPVFERLKPAVLPFVYDSFYPEGWAVRQSAEIVHLLHTEPQNVWIAAQEGLVIGWVGIRLHPDDRMGEIYILAVDPKHQQKGVGRQLMIHAFGQMRAAGMRMVMVETGDDSGHAASRAAYEAVGFQRWPVARYFREL